MKKPVYALEFSDGEMWQIEQAAVVCGWRAEESDQFARQLLMRSVREIRSSETRAKAARPITHHLSERLAHVLGCLWGRQNWESPLRIHHVPARLPASATHVRSS